MSSLNKSGRDVLEGLSAGPLALDEPVFVLTCARSGSTLLRMILDAHPELACPPETNVAKLCAQLSDIWISLNPDCNKQTLTEQALLHIRGIVSSLFEDYLTRRGKVRWCDKSLGTSDVADQFLHIYQKAKFICLYRHAMDVVSSGLDASPWGLYGYGFEQFARGTGNSVAALVAYWIECTTQTLNFEEAHPDRCIRVYYEELVSEPERVAEALFEFIGVAQAPGITRYALLNQERPEVFGWGDHKIRAGSRINDASLGRGIRVPASLIPQSQANSLNQILARLGYAEVNRYWQMSTCPPVLLVRPEGQPASEDSLGPDNELPFVTEAPHQSAGVPDSDPRVARFQAFDDEIVRRITRSIKTLPTALQEWRAVGVVSYSLASPRIAQAWRIACAAEEVTSDLDTDFKSLDVDWVFTGEIEVWQSLLSGVENLAAALRHGHIRCIGKEMAEDNPAAVVERSRGLMDLRIRMVTHLLELGIGGLD